MLLFATNKTISDYIHIKKIIILKQKPQRAKYYSNYRKHFFFVSARNKVIICTYTVQNWADWSVYSPRESNIITSSGYIQYSSLFFRWLCIYILDGGHKFFLFAFGLSSEWDDYFSTNARSRRTS